MMLVALLQIARCWKESSFKCQNIPITRPHSFSPHIIEQQAWVIWESPHISRFELEQSAAVSPEKNNALKTAWSLAKMKVWAGSSDEETRILEWMCCKITSGSAKRTGSACWAVNNPSFQLFLSHVRQVILHHTASSGITNPQKRLPLCASVMRRKDCSQFAN